METIFQKEKRVKRSFLWHRLLFRAADSLAILKKGVNMIMIKKNILLSVLSFFAFTGLCYAQDSPTRAITQITGDLYRFQNNAHYSVFLVTSEGIIATDPINEDAAKWLKSELKRRFDKPVKYLVYSHDHGDHIGGGHHGHGCTLNI